MPIKFSVLLRHPVTQRVYFHISTYGIRRSLRHLTCSLPFDRHTTTKLLKKERKKEEEEEEKEEKRISLLELELKHFEGRIKRNGKKVGLKKEKMEKKQKNIRKRKIKEESKMS